MRHRDWPTGRVCPEFYLRKSMKMLASNSRITARGVPLTTTPKLRVIYASHIAPGSLSQMASVSLTMLCVLAHVEDRKANACVKKWENNLNTIILREGSYSCTLLFALIWWMMFDCKIHGKIYLICSLSGIKINLHFTVKNMWWLLFFFFWRLP